MYLKTYGNIIAQLVLLSNLYKIKYELECKNAELGNTLSGEKQSQGGAVLFCITNRQSNLIYLYRSHLRRKIEDLKIALEGLVLTVDSDQFITHNVVDIDTYIIHTTKNYIV